MQSEGAHPTIGAAMEPQPGRIRLAAGQITARLMNEAGATLASIEQAMTQAAARHAELLILPECAYPAYLLGSIRSYREGDHLSSEAFVAWLARRTAKHRMTLVCGFVEDTGAALHNTAVVIDHRGCEVGRARKRFLWNADRDWYTPGDQIRAFDTPVGRIGVAICAEARVPEIIATLAADGAELIALPTCWINAARNPGEYENPQTGFMIEARAREFGLPFICADKAGMEMPGTNYVGMSRIVRADGSVAVEAPPEGDAVIVAELPRGASRRVWVADAWRERLLDDRPPVRPASGQVREVTVAAVPTQVIEGRFTGGMGENLLQPLQRQGVEVLLANMTREESAERLAMLANAFGIRAATFPVRTDLFTLGPARVGCVSGQAVRSFTGPRCLALEGLEILLVFDAPEDLALLRTRALENRVFVAGANRQTGVVVGPDGAVLAHASANDPREAVVRIDLSAAGDKNVAPRTDIFDERRVALYRF